MILSTKTPPHIITLVFAAALGPLAMNVFLPSLPGIKEFFNTTEANAQLSVSLYLTAVAILQLVFGPLSDKFGRRPVILIAFCIMIIGTIICIVATTIEWFLAGRIIQASSSAGLVLSRAIARDLTKGTEAAALIAYITMGMSLAPMIGPVMGGYLDEIYGWQSSFYLTLGFAVVALSLAYLDLGETNKHKQSSLKQQIEAYPELLQSRRFWGYAVTAMFSSGAFFAFLGGGPLVANSVYKLSPSQYGLYFMFISIGYLLGNWISSRITTRIGINQMMLSGNLVVGLGLAGAVLMIASGSTHPLSFFGFVFFVGIGNGMTLPSANAGVVNVRPSLAGSASGLAGSLQLGGGAILSVIGGYVISAQSGALPLAVMMLITIICATFGTLYVMRVEREIQQTLAKANE